MFELGEEPLELAPLLEAVADPAHGAVVGFLGVVRAEDGLDGLEYSAYTKMALAMMEKIGREMGERFGPLRVAARHRLGRLAVGEASLALAVASPHRKEALQAASYFVDRLKEVVPIWKEAYPSQGGGS